MKMFIFALAAGMLFGSCVFGQNDAAEVVNDVKAGAQEASDILRENAVQTKEAIDRKVDQANRVVDEVQQLREAVTDLFGESSDALKDIDLCTQNSDCVLVEYNGCCTKNKAINKAFLKAYQSIPELQKDDIDCNLIQCTVANEYSGTECLKDNEGLTRCVLVNPDR